MCLLSCFLWYQLLSAVCTKQMCSKSSTVFKSLLCCSINFFVSMLDGYINNLLLPPGVLLYWQYHLDWWRNIESLGIYFKDQKKFLEYKWIILDKLANIWILAVISRFQFLSVYDHKSLRSSDQHSPGISCAIGKRISFHPITERASQLDYPFSRKKNAFFTEISLHAVPMWANGGGTSLAVATLYLRNMHTGRLW